MPWPHFTPQENSWYSFLLEDESNPGPKRCWKHGGGEENKIKNQ
jgi:hypothetical protein